MNKVTLLGRLCGDPELKHTPAGNTVVNFSLATNKTWKNKDGEKQEKAEFHRIVCWQKTAEVIDQYFSKGDLMLLEGEIQTREWKDKDDNRRWTTEILLQNFHFVGSGSKKENSSTTTQEMPADANFSSDDIPF